jgi:hypothetical protein
MDLLSLSNIFSEQGFLSATEQVAPHLHVQYIDYAYWMRSIWSTSSDSSSLEYWTLRLTDHGIVLDIPLDFPRPQVFTFRGDTVVCNIDAH